MNKGTDGRYQDSKEAAEMVPVKIQRMVIEVAEISLQGMAIEIIETCQHISRYYRPKENLTNGDKKQTHLTNQEIFHVVPCISLSIIVLMIS